MQVKEIAMKSLLIKDTTQDERRRIVEESLGMLGGCDDCMKIRRAPGGVSLRDV